MLGASFHHFDETLWESKSPAQLRQAQRVNAGCSGALGRGAVSCLSEIAERGKKRKIDEDSTSRDVRCKASDLCGLASDHAPLHLGAASKIDVPR